MATITTSSSRTLLFLRHTKPLLHPVHNATITFSPPIRKLTSSLRITHHSYKPHVHKVKASLFPLHAPIFLTTSPKQAFSSALALLFAVAKRVMAKLNTHEFQVPLVEVAKQAGKWVDLYQGILMIRVLLSWFPNLPWEKQPFSAIRHLTDPFIYLCRSIVPPYRGVEISVSFAFIFLGVLSNLLTSNAVPPSSFY